MSYQDFIEVRPGKRSGKPCVKGTRITVYDVLEWFADGMSQDEIIEDFPHLTPEQLDACLAYAAERNIT